MKPVWSMEISWWLWEAISTGQTPWWDTKILINLFSMLIVYMEIKLTSCTLLLLVIQRWVKQVSFLTHFSNFIFDLKLQARNEKKDKWTVKTDDFMPYSNGPHGQYWSGYFTSRPGFKGYVWDSNPVLQMCHHMNLRNHQHGNNHRGDEIEFQMAAVMLKNYKCHTMIEHRATRNF